MFATIKNLFGILNIITTDMSNEPSIIYIHKHKIKTENINDEFATFAAEMDNETLAALLFVLKVKFFDNFNNFNLISVSNGEETGNVKISKKETESLLSSIVFNNVDIKLICASEGTLFVDYVFEEEYKILKMF